MDKYTNPHVERSCMEMIRMANTHRFEVQWLKWDEKYKEVDVWIVCKDKNLEYELSSQTAFFIYG